MRVRGREYNTLPLLHTNLYFPVLSRLSWCGSVLQFAVQPIRWTCARVARVRTKRSSMCIVAKAGWMKECTPARGDLYVPPDTSLDSLLLGRHHVAPAAQRAGVTLAACASSTNLTMAAAGASAPRTRVLLADKGVFAAPEPERGVSTVLPPFMIDAPHPATGTQAYKLAAVPPCVRPILLCPHPHVPFCRCRSCRRAPAVGGVRRHHRCAVHNSHKPHPHGLLVHR